MYEKVELGNSNKKTTYQSTNIVSFLTQTGEQRSNGQMDMMILFSNVNEYVVLMSKMGHLPS